MLAAMRSLLSKRAASPFVLVAETYRFLDGFVRSAEPYRAASAGKLHGYYVDAALAFIAERYRSDIGVEDIARHVGLNRSYFGKIFKETMGVSPQQFLIGYRMEKAADLLKLSALSVAEVGRAVGLPQPVAFLARVQVRPRGFAAGVAPGARGEREHICPTSRLCGSPARWSHRPSGVPGGLR